MANEVSSNLQRRLVTVRRQAAKLYEEERAIVSQLQGNCDHHETALYRWEHDNGYGQQSWVRGKRCVFCGWLDLWNSNHFVNPDDCFN